MFNPKPEEKDAQYEAVNKHMAAQPAIKMLTQKVKNFCTYITDCYKEGKLDCLGNEQKEALVERIRVLKHQIEPEPVPFVQAIHILGATFFNVKTREFNFEALKLALPQIKKMAASIPDADIQPALLNLDLDALPTDIAEKTKAYVNCFCNFVIPQ